MKITNPQYNASKELTAFDGILIDQRTKKAVLTDKKTVDLINEVKKLPRVTAYTGSAAPRVVVDGKEYALSYKFFTKEEVDTYNAYRGKHSGTGNSGSSKVAEFETFLMTLKNNPEIMKLLTKEQKEFMDQHARDRDREECARFAGVPVDQLTEEQFQLLMSIRKGAKN